MVATFGILLLGSSTFFVCYQFLAGEIEASVAKRLEEQRKVPSSALLKICRPLFNSLVLPSSQKLQVESWKKKNKRYIISAGLEFEIDVEELLAYKIFLGLVVPFGLFIYQLATNGLWPLWMYPGMMVLMYMYPSLWVSGTRKKRQEEIKLQMPFVIDLLTLSTEGGLDFIGALHKVVEKTRSGPLVDEIERMLQEIQLGTTRADALRSFGWRIDLTEISSFVAVLVTADQMGSPLGGVLRVQSELLRNRRFSEAEKKGAAASQKLLFPLIFFIMPAVFIMIFGPVILGFLGGGGGIG